MFIRLLSNAPGESSEAIGSFKREDEELDAVRHVTIPELSKAMSAYGVPITSEEEEIREKQLAAYYHQYRIAVTERTAVYTNRGGFTNLVCPAVSFQTSADTGRGTWISNITSGEGAFYQVNTIGLRSGVLREPISDYEASRRFGLYARSLITKQGLKVISTNIRDWASAEDPDWKQLVIDFEVEAKPDVALALWDMLDDEFQTFLDALEGRLSPDLRDLISISVQWK